MAFTIIKKNISSECAVINISLPAITESQEPTHLLLHYGGKSVGSGNLTFLLIVMYLKEIKTQSAWEMIQELGIPCSRIFLCSLTPSLP